ncbi:MAG: hypothetical protein V4696_11470 [Pseudomonadota bacterium]
MAKTIFWSWQSDISARETRNITRDALVDAIDKLAASLEEAERPEIDHDTRGVPGTPEIATTILSKIDQATIFVADVTPIAISPTGKHLANPNVLIELGYAKKALSTARMILVWNTAIHQSTPEDLPFDLRHRRGPISFNLPIGSDKSTLKKARADLVDALYGALSDILSSLPPEIPDKLAWHEADLEHPAVWAENAKGLPVNHGMDDPADIMVHDDELGFARILPTIWNVRPNALEILEHATQHPIPLGRTGGLNWGPTTRGFLVYRHNDSVSSSGVTTTATRWFRETGELWGVDSQFCRESGDHFMYSELYAAERWLAWLKQNVSLCTILGGSPPFHVVLGIEGLRGVRWARDSYSGSVPQALEENMNYKFELASDDESLIRQHLLRALNRVRDAFGLTHISVADLQTLSSRFLG